MTSTTSTLAPIAGYTLKPPSEEDARAALERVFGPERGAERWSDACRAAGLKPGSVGPGAPFERAVEALAAQGGAAAMTARSMEIRLRTYTRLASNAAAAAGGSR
jgi:hypothetical protein